jgi:hypothetical protein
MSASKYATLGLPYYKDFSELQAADRYSDNLYHKMKSWCEVKVVNGPSQVGPVIQLNPDGPLRKFSPWAEMLARTQLVANGQVSLLAPTKERTVALQGTSGKDAPKNHAAIQGRSDEDALKNFVKHKEKNSGSKSSKRCAVM